MTAVPRQRAVDLTYTRATQTLRVSFADGRRIELPAEYLRVESPSAEVQGHGPGQKTIVGGKRHVGITRIEPVGSYAVRLVFDDGHDSGLYTWDYLYQLGAERESRWCAYLRALAEKGLSRDPVGRA